MNLRFMTPAPRLDFAKAGAPLTGRGVVTLLLAAMAVFLAGASVAHAKSDLPDVDIMLVTEIHDTTGWLRMHQEVLRAPLDRPRPWASSCPLESTVTARSRSTIRGSPLRSSLRLGLRS